MQTLISLFRGINVSGKNLIKMDALKKSYENLGFHNVTTYVQSGNIVFFANDEKVEALEQKIKKQIELDYDLEVPVLVLFIEKLKQIIDNNPFVKDKDIAFLYVTFLSLKPKIIDFKAIEDKKQNGEEIYFLENVVYLYCPNGYGKTKLTNNFLESKLKVCATTRNWKTINELVKIAEQLT